MSNLSLFHRSLILKKASEFRQLFPDSDLILSLFDGSQWLRYEFLSKNPVANFPNLYFDLASLTKIFTSNLVLETIKYQKLKLNTSVSSIIPALTHFKHLQLYQLLNHSSHLDLINKFSVTTDYSKADFEDIIFSPTNLECKRESNKYNYSDLNYIYLGKILEKIIGKNLSTLIDEMNQKYGFDLLFNPSLRLNSKNIMPTSKNVQPGLVWDFKAEKLGGVAGHAGLFAKLEDIENCSLNWIYNEWHFSSELLNQAYFAPNNQEIKGEVFGLSFRNGRLSNLPNHSGFTGPTMVLNPEKETALVHFNNYTYSDFTENKRDLFRKWNIEICRLFPE